MSNSEVVDTHKVYDTINHEHLDSLVSWATGEFPDAGLNLVECADGRSLRSTTGGLSTTSQVFPGRR